MCSERDMARRDAAVDGAAVLAFASAAAFEVWLCQHQDHAPGVWLKLAKKSSGIQSLTDDEAVDVGLCFGWISGQRRALDASFYLQKYVPRRARSVWSQVNVRKALQLIAAGRVRPRGLAEIAAARADGRWDAAYASQREAQLPDALQAALADSARARRAFEALGRSEQYALMLKVMTARTPQLRQARVRSVVADLRAR
jgi:uncharacterized protein YdeI (YjbR/CyaY-like superfamily)